MTSHLSGDHGSPLPRNLFLVARRELLVRLRSRVFAVTTIVMVVIVGGGILASGYLNAGTSSQPAAMHVGFSGESQALEPSFRSVAAALGQAVTVTATARVRTVFGVAVGGRSSFTVRASTTTDITEVAAG